MAILSLNKAGTLALTTISEERHSFTTNYSNHFQTLEISSLNIRVSMYVEIYQLITDCVTVSNFNSIFFIEVITNCNVFKAS